MPPRKFEHFEGRRRTDVYEDVSAFVQWGETFRGRYPDLPNEGAYYHFPEDYKLGYWDPSMTRWSSQQWESFRDPAKMTYRTYIQLQTEREQALDAVLASSRAGGGPRHLDESWLDALRMFFAPLRFAEWGVSMVHQYVGRFAISGLITNCALLQTVDELRHTQRIAEWTRQLEGAHGGFDDYRRQWMEDDLFQPLRELLERLCVVRDWGEAVVACDLLLEPLLQPVLHTAFQELGAANGDTVLPHLGHSLFLDEERHWAWARALAGMVSTEDPRNAQLTGDWVRQWWPLVERAVVPFRAVFEAVGQPTLFDTAYDEARAEVQASLVELGLEHAGEAMTPAAEPRA